MKQHAHSDYGTLGPLFEQGRVLRDEGIRVVSEHNENWTEQALKYAAVWVEDRKHWQWDFTGEEIRFDVTMGIGHPNHPNAWGALINTLIKRKIIVPTGEHRQMKDKTSHARQTPVYKAI